MEYLSPASVLTCIHIYNVSVSVTPQNFSIKYSKPFSRHSRELPSALRGKHSGRVFDLISRGWGLNPHRRHCVVSLSMTLYPLLSKDSTQEDLTVKLLTGI